MRLENYRKSTTIDLNQEQHAQILAAMTEESYAYNPINQNCLSVMKRVVERVTGVAIETKSSLLEAYGGVNLNKIGVLRYVPGVRQVAAVCLYFLAVVRNLGMACIGGFKKHNGVAVFNHWYDVFNPRKGMPDHPRAMRAWQERGVLTQKQERGILWYVKDFFWPQDERDGVLNIL